MGCGASTSAPSKKYTARTAAEEASPEKKADAEKTLEEPPKVGQCFCGAVKVTCTGPPVAKAVCHCKSCRSWGGGAGQLVSLYPEACVKIEGAVDEFSKPGKLGPDGGPFSVRKSCKVCHGSVCNAHPGLKKIDVCGGLFGYDASAQFSLVKGGVNCYKPFEYDFHINYEDTMLPVYDTKPKFKDFPAKFGGSDEKVDEATYPKPLAEKTPYTDETVVKGTCYCGAVTVQCTGKPMAKALCHCGFCRAWSGGIGQLVNLYPAEQVMVAGELLSYTKPNSRWCAGGTNFSHRKVCAVCKGKVLNEHKGIGKVDVCGGILDYSNGTGPVDGTFEFDMHVHYESTIFPYLPDGKVKFADFPPAFSGSGNTLNDDGSPLETPKPPEEAIAEGVAKQERLTITRNEAIAADAAFT